MTGITGITRDWGDNVAIVRINTTDTLVTALATGYITAQQANIELANNGMFTWLTTDMTLVQAADGWAFASISADFSSLNLLSSNGAISVPITAAQFNGMYAAPVLLVPAPGANQLIVVNRMELVMTFGSADFASGGPVAAQWGSTIHGAGPLATNAEAAADFFAAASTTFMFNGNAGNTVGAVPFSTSVNQGIYLSNTTGAFTTGNSNFIAKVRYQTISSVS